MASQDLSQTKTPGPGLGSSLRDVGCAARSLDGFTSPWGLGGAGRGAATQPGVAGGGLGVSLSLTPVFSIFPAPGTHLPRLPLLLPTAANMNLDRIGEQAEAMFGVG